MTDFIYGINAVQEWLSAGFPAEEMLVVQGDRSARVQLLLALAKERGLKSRSVPAEELTRLLGRVSHQSVAARVPPFPYSNLEDIFRRAAARREPPCMVLLDGVEDPRNLGAILRSAEGAGLHGVIIPKDRAAGVTPVALKTAAGAAAHLPVVRVTNIARTVKILKERGLWIGGASEEAPGDLYDADFSGPVALVLGGEGKGIRRLVRDECDFLVSIPMAGKISSLNVSVAAAILFFELRRQRRGHSKNHNGR